VPRDQGVLYGYPIVAWRALPCKRFSGSKLAREEKLFSFAVHGEKCDERCFCQPDQAVLAKHFHLIATSVTIHIDGPVSADMQGEGILTLVEACCIITS
jgi:hypothetical protein